MLVRETEDGQRPVYFVSKALKGAEIRYQKVEKVALALVKGAEIRYQILVRTDQPIRQILHRHDLAGRLIKWVVELSEFGVKYESRTALKAQILDDFVAELHHPSKHNPPLSGNFMSTAPLTVKGVGQRSFLKTMTGWWSKSPSPSPSQHPITIIEGKLYRRGFSTPLLKCLKRKEAEYVLTEIHKGIVGQHLGERLYLKRHYGRDTTGPPFSKTTPWRQGPS